MTSRLKIRNVTTAGGRSSMRLEPEIWDALDEISRRERLGLPALVKSIEAAQKGISRTSAVRTFAFLYFRAAATEAGHRHVGHGPPD